MGGESERSRKVSFYINHLYRSHKMSGRNFVQMFSFLHRARSIYERALDVDHRNITLWLKYAEMEMKSRQVNHARNIWDRAITILPRVNQFWYGPSSWLQEDSEETEHSLICVCLTGTSTHIWRRCWGTLRAAGRCLRDGWSGSQKNRPGIPTSTLSCAIRRWTRLAAFMRVISFNSATSALSHVFQMCPACKLSITSYVL